MLANVTEQSLGFGLLYSWNRACHNFQYIITDFQNSCMKNGKEEK